MTATDTVLVQHQSSVYHNNNINNIKSTSPQLIKRHCCQANLLIPRHCSSIVYINNFIMSKALIHELDLKMQQVKEYGLIAHGYHNEHMQYPTHVRRSHDGEKVPRTLPTFDKHHKTNRLTNINKLTLSTNESETSSTKRKSLYKKQQLPDDHQKTFVAPPNKTINDIDPSINRNPSYTTGNSLTRYYYHRKSSSSANSSPILCSLRPHSIVCLSTTETTTTDSCENSKVDEQQQDQSNSFSDSSQSLVHQSASRTSRRTLTQKFFSKLFQNSSRT